VVQSPGRPSHDLRRCFERHPELTLVLTEQPGQWWPYLELELDTAHRAATRDNPALRAQVPKAPSDYLHRNVYVGASFLSRDEALGAVRDGYADRLMWGADYPHMEGTFQAGDTALTPLSLRFTLAGLDESTISAIAGGTAARVYGLDTGALTYTAASIGAPTFADLSEPLDAIPAGASPFAFRTTGPWA
jgi:predicted TIM-barrel fold metal-dependent hydrolase